MKKLSFLSIRLTVLIITSLLAVSATFAQAAKSADTDSGSQKWLYMAIGGGIALLAAVAYWKFKGKTGVHIVKGSSYSQRMQSRDSWNNEPLDADKEMEWLRRNKKAVGGRDPKKFPGKLPQTGDVFKKKRAAGTVGIDSEELLEKIQKFQFSKLPINSFTAIRPSKQYNLLPLSSDEALMSAIEQAHDEFEEDEAVRDLAVRILAAFKTRNSVESLSQIALYDLSSNLRSKAVSILTDFDHESVFETLLLACADPTREVRAAAARGIFRLSFDRADAWTRLMETGDEFRTRHAARAAIEANLVEKTLERLVHEDLKVAYEAFTLTALLLKTGETEKIFKALKSHPDPNVQKALMLVFKVTKEPNALDGLYALLEMSDIPEEIRQEADALVAEIGLVAA